MTWLKKQSMVLGVVVAFVISPASGDPWAERRESIFLGTNSGDFLRSKVGALIGAKPDVDARASEAATVPMVASQQGDNDVLIIASNIEGAPRSRVNKNKAVDPDERQFAIKAIQPKPDGRNFRFTIKRIEDSKYGFRQYQFIADREDDVFPRNEGPKMTLHFDSRGAMTASPEITESKTFHDERTTITVSDPLGLSLKKPNTGRQAIGMHEYGQMPLGNGTIIRFVGDIRFNGQVFIGSTEDPLVFTLTDSKGLVYQSGVGEVILEDNRRVTLPLGRSAPSGTTAATSKRGGDGELKRPICGQGECSAPGTTIPPTKARSGDSCSGDPDCKSGGMVCWRAQCRKLSPSGAKCLGHLDCAEGLLCLQGACSSRDTAAAAQSTAKGSCSRDADCKSGMVCRKTECTKSSLLGAVCTANSDCAAGLMCWKAECTADTSMETRRVRTGDRCYEDADCKPGGMVCSKTQCRKLSPSGAKCLGNLDCAEGLLCLKGACSVVQQMSDSNEVTEKYIVIEGGYCNESSDCVRGLVCSTHICARLNGELTCPKGECPSPDRMPTDPARTGDSLLR